MDNQSVMQKIQIKIKKSSAADLEDRSIRISPPLQQKTHPQEAKDWRGLLWLLFPYCMYCSFCLTEQKVNKPKT